MGSTDPLALVPLPIGRLRERDRTPDPRDTTSYVFHLGRLSDWATDVIRRFTNWSGIFGSATSKALRLRDALRSAGVPGEMEVEFCSFESRHLAKLRIDPADEKSRAVASTLCAVTMAPIAERYGAWIDNGKPISLRPDLVSYEELLMKRVPRAMIQEASHNSFIDLIQHW